MNLLDSFHLWISSLHANEAELYTAIISGIFTLIIACIGIKAAFKQIRKQFEHKVIYEGVKDFQAKLYAFSSKLASLWTEVINLKYFLKSQQSLWINKGNLEQYRFNEWKKFSDTHIEMQKAYVDYLVSFETHEILFLGLKKMQTLFSQEMKKKLEDKFMDFSNEIFPEMAGEQNSLTQSEREEKIDSFSEDISDLQVYLQDIRMELQNETMGKILNKQVEKRKPIKKYKVLTRKGWF